MSNQAKDKPLAAIRCITYNHEPYIRDALEGFVMQKTTFPFVAIVHDDASTDGTAAIIREYAEKYPDIIKPIYETENQYSKKDGSLRRIMDEACEATGAKYIATCEGDDYWIDPLKLQKQVDILESNSDIGAVYTDFEAIDAKTSCILPHTFNPKSGNQYEAMISEKLNIWTLTTCSRTEFWQTRPVPASSTDMFTGDSFFFLWVCANSEVYCLNEKTAVYRKLESSASHFTDMGKAIYFQYKVANSFEWFLINGPKISNKTRKEVLYKIGKSKLKHAIYTANAKYVNEIDFPLGSVSNIRTFALWMSPYILGNKYILRLAKKLIFK